MTSIVRGRELLETDQCFFALGGSYWSAAALPWPAGAAAVSGLPSLSILRSKTRKSKICRHEDTYMILSIRGTRVR